MLLPVPRAAVEPARSKEAGAVVERAAHRIRVTAPDPERRVGLLERFGFQGRAIKLPEATGEGNARLGCKWREL